MTTEPASFITAPYVRLGEQDGKYFLAFGSIQQVIEDHAIWAAIVRLLDVFRFPSTIAHAKVQALKQHSGTERDIAAAAEMLVSGRYVIERNAYDCNSRYSRPSLYYAMSGARPMAVQERLAASHVVIIGCGGIGNLVSVTLATSGVGSLTLIDGDRIEESNLTRQFMFTEKHVGRSKGEVLAEELQARSSACQIRTRDLMIDVHTDLDEIPAGDLVVVSADSVGILPLLNNHFVRRGQPWLNTAYVNDVAVWGPLVIPGETGCWTCRQLIAQPTSISTDIQEGMRRINAGYQAPSCGPINMLSSSMAALDALRYLGGFGKPASLGRRVGLWTHDLAVEHQDARRNPNCHICAKEVSS